MTPSRAYNSLITHFSKPDPYVHDKLRSQIESRHIGKNEKIAKHMKWHREIRAQMIDAKFPGIAVEKGTIKWVVRGLSNHMQYSQLASSWRASGHPASLSELEAILANEEADMDRNRRMDGQLQALLKQVNRRPNNQFNQHQPPPQQNQQQQKPPQNAQQIPKQYRGRGRGGGGRGRGSGQNAQPKPENHENLAQQVETLEAQLAELREKAANANANDNNTQGDHRRVNFNDNINDFAEAVA